MSIMTTAVPFPDVQPQGYEWFDNEPAFDATRHLQLEAPTERLSLADLGYNPKDTRGKATQFAVSSPFRILSDEGVSVMLDSCRRLRSFNTRAGERIERATRGGCYRSRFLRDVCINPELTGHMSLIYGVDVAPHPMALHLGHLNFEPADLTEAVDKWHHDTLPLDFVMMVTDPATLSGGEFEWFHGTKAEAADLAAAGLTPPPARVVQPDFQGPGSVIALHGDMVVHRGGALTAAGERITMVNGYVAADTSTDEQSRSADLIGIDDPEALWTEWAKFAAWRSVGRLQSVIDTLAFGATADQAASVLEHAIEAAQTAAAEMRAGKRSQMEHYE